MSHHFDSPTAIEDGRINLCDLYVFPGPRDMSTLLLTVNPDAARSSATTFRPDALYEFDIASGGTSDDVSAIRMRFGEPDAGGRQEVCVLHAVGDELRNPLDGSVLGNGRTGYAFSLEGSGLAWFGIAADPFWGDGPALFQFLQSLAAGKYEPEVMSAAPSNIFAGRNVTAAALQVPNAILGSEDVSVWARIILYGHAPSRQVSRMGNPMLRPLFFPLGGADAEELNAGNPVDDVRRHGRRLRLVAAQLATGRGLADPEGHASLVAGAFLPDVLRYRAGAPARFGPGTGNGRALDDDAFGTALSLLNGSPLGMSPSPHAVLDFPHLEPANSDDLPALADLFGLRQQVAEEAS